MRCPCGADKLCPGIRGTYALVTLVVVTLLGYIALVALAAR